MTTTKKSKQKKAAKPRARKRAVASKAAPKRSKRATTAKRKPAANKRTPLAIPKAFVRQSSVPRPRMLTWLHRVEAVFASLVLVLAGVITNAAVLHAAGRDMAAAEAQAAFAMSEYKQPKEYLFDRATEKGLDYNVLERIAFCESNWRMVQNKKSSAYGFFQIIDGTERHTPSYKNGDRKYDAQANIDMAVYLYDRYGVYPWAESRPCWKHALK